MVGGRVQKKAVSGGTVRLDAALICRRPPYSWGTMGRGGERMGVSSKQGWVA